MSPICRLNTFRRVATLERCRAGDAIYTQGAPADYWYGLLSGAARQGTLTADGRRHIVNFLLPGDLFGFGSRGKHQFSAEALVGGTIFASYPRRQLESLAEADPQIGREVREAAFEAIARLQMRMVLLARPTAVEKVSAFLLEMSNRSSGGNLVVLPMSRYDIADYLAIAVETVSRAMTMLRASGVIVATGSRKISIRDHSALEIYGGLRGIPLVKHYPSA
jgi:CRP-like cAMP-binding protein